MRRLKYILAQWFIIYNSRSLHAWKLTCSGWPEIYKNILKILFNALRLWTSYSKIFTKIFKNKHFYQWRQMRKNANCQILLWTFNIMNYDYEIFNPFFFVLGSQIMTVMSMANERNSWFLPRVGDFSGKISQILG